MEVDMLVYNTIRRAWFLFGGDGSVWCMSSPPDTVPIDAIRVG